MPLPITVNFAVIVTAFKRWHYSEKRSVLRHCHREASFKRLIHHKHNHENTWERIQRWRICVPRGIWRPTIVTEKPWSRSWKVLVFQSVRPRICQGLDDDDSVDEREPQIISQDIGNTSPVPSKHAFNQLYPANSTASLCVPGYVYNFSLCSVTLKIPWNDAVQNSTSDRRRGWQHLFIKKSDSEWSDLKPFWMF